MGDWDTNRCAIGHRAGRILGNCWNWETRSHHHRILVWLQDGTIVWVADGDTNRIMHFNIWSFAIELSEIITLVHGCPKVHGGVPIVLYNFVDPL